MASDGTKRSGVERIHQKLRIVRQEAEFQRERAAHACGLAERAIARANDNGRRAGALLRKIQTRWDGYY
jgi:hypothetical protein